MSLQVREKFSDIVIQATNLAVFVPNPCKNAESATIEGAFVADWRHITSHPTLGVRDPLQRALLPATDQGLQLLLHRSPDQRESSCGYVVA